MIWLIPHSAGFIPCLINVPHFAELITGTVGSFLRRGSAVANTADQNVQGREAGADQPDAAFGIAMLILESVNELCEGARS